LAITFAAWRSCRNEKLIIKTKRNMNDLFSAEIETAIAQTAVMHCLNCGTEIVLK